MVVLIDAKYYGAMLRRARRQQKIRSQDAAKILRVSVRQMHSYERGQEQIPEHIVMRLFYRGFCLLKCQKNI